MILSNNEQVDLVSSNYLRTKVCADLFSAETFTQIRIIALQTIITGFSVDKSDLFD